ncbi:hypothetical protein GGR88_002301 [Sphingomonas jejuensis]|uniref:DUF4064 domain-containing protein n=1 Tax=Sphingomonas jejuensis TaxID=904715 RepID=A0ABX0XPZ7_9SPHN|nr:hypothetical protein [Sphingomonas jejuensis]NJC34787.1 hypothetical protein [Sphingomonas jejuensis]
MRAVLGLIVGIVVGVLTVALVERIGGLLAPAPPSFTRLTPAELPAAIAALPLANKLSVVLAWFLGALGGAALAVGVSCRAWPGWVVAGLILALVLLTILAITHPLWMAIAGIAGPLLAGFIATRLAR